MKKLILALAATGLLALSATSALAQAEPKEKKKKKAESTANTATAPKSVIHIVTVNFKEGTTPAQIQAAVDGVHKLPAAYPGITRVWTRAIKNQTEMSHIFVMEFASEQALKDYSDSPAQKEWYKVYTDIRARSVTSDITN